MYRDLRDWLEEVRRLGELRKIRSVDWDLELGAIAEVSLRENSQAGRNPPALLFDDIKGYPAGYRVLTGMLGSVERLGLTCGMTLPLSRTDFIAHWRELMRDLKSIPPRFVDGGPVLENVETGDRVDLLEFPTPRWHEHDGGRYIGTGSVTITHDPEEGWVNLGTYRVMLYDKKTLGFYISPGKQGRIHREKYFARGEPCPVALCVGQDPLLFLLSGLEMPYGVSEYEIAGALRDEPVEVIRGPVTGLPIPASAEIVMEGFSMPGETRMEGPFGEWTGYYGSSERQEPIIRVEAVLHRNDPILCGAPVSKPPNDVSLMYALARSALIWEELEKAGVPEIRGVACHEAVGHRLFVVVSLKQRYPGHARQAGLIASQCHGGAYLGRYVIVVDEDIDPTNLHEVMWAVATRSDPEKDIEIVRRCWSGPLDPIMPPGEKGFNSRAIIDACRPYEWKESFPHVAQCSRELRDRVVERWGEVIFR